MPTRIEPSILAPGQLKAPCEYWAPHMPSAESGQIISWDAVAPGVAGIVVYQEERTGSAAGPYVSHHFCPYRVPWYGLVVESMFAFATVIDDGNVCHTE
jgi:hypothetical protein